MNQFRLDYYLLQQQVELPTPNLLLYPELIQHNIQSLLSQASPDSLRPHVKTNKCSEVVKMMMDQGIYKYKCATLQEANMLLSVGVADVLIAFPLVGYQLKILIDLQKQYPDSSIKILVDSKEAALQLQALAMEQSISQQVYIDINLGMNRTGVEIDKLFDFAKFIHSLEFIQLVGFHGYDGHIREVDLEERAKQVKPVFESVLDIVDTIQSQLSVDLKLVFGGSNTFPIYNQYPDVECSPGTFVLWDWGYQTTLPEQSFHIAALLLSRVVSKPSKDHLCLDLGYKAISSENPIDKRLEFLGKENWEIVSQSEEHLVVKVTTEEWNNTSIDSLVYIIPYHICPTVAIYPRFQVVNNGKLTALWKIHSRY